MKYLLFLLPFNLIACEKCDQVLQVCQNNIYRISNDLFEYRDDPDYTLFDFNQGRLTVYCEIREMILGDKQ